MSTSDNMKYCVCLQCQFQSVLS